MQHASQSLGHLLARARPHLECLRNRGKNERRIVEGLQADPEDTVGKQLRDAFSGLDRQPRLAASTDTDQGHQPALAQQPLELGGARARVRRSASTASAARPGARAASAGNPGRPAARGSRAAARVARGRARCPVPQPAELSRPRRRRALPTGALSGRARASVGRVAARGRDSRRPAPRARRSRSACRPRARSASTRSSTAASRNSSRAPLSARANGSQDELGERRPAPERERLLEHVGRALRLACASA